ncbi:hypothetical protein [Flavobacterium sp. PS2]|uniref:hypothetical protein n=1 Tax=Flavobacterium sp. PS2 TaxID=3384157 RepID=UPI00390C4862
MKNKLLPLLFVLGSYSAYSQVGIGTPLPNASSQLEVVASDKGILIPRINLTSSTDATTITNGNQNSLLVFNTANVADIKAGYYYWYDNKWNRIVISNEVAPSTGTVIYNPTTQQFTYVDASGVTQTVDFTQVVKSSETLTTLTKDAANDGKYVYKSEDATTTTIDVVGDVINNASSIVNNPIFTTELANVIKTDETLTTLTKDAANDGKYLYTSENATGTTIDVVGDVITNSSTILNNPAFKTEITNVIKDEETITTLVNNGGGSYTYNNEAGTPVNIDVVGDVTTNFSTIANNPAVTTIIENIATKTVGAVTFDSTTNQFSYTDAAGNPQVVDISTIVKANETLTTLDKDPANNGKYLYTSENATGTTIDVVGDVITNASTILSDPTFTTELTNIIAANETLTTLVNNGGGSYTYNNEAGTPVNIDVVGDVTTNFSTIANNPAVTTIIQEISTKTEGAVTFDSTTNQFSYTDASGNPQVVDISTIVKANETLTTLTKDAANDGKYVYTSENTTATTIDVVGDVISNASTILNDPTFTTELTNIIAANETLTTLVNNGGGSYTYNNEAGTPVNIDVVGDVTTNFSTIANNPAVTTIIQEIATKTAGAVTFDSTTNQFSYTDAAGVPQLVDISTIVKANETLTTLTKDAANDGKYVYTSENTTATTIDVVGDVITNSSTILNDPAFKTELTTVIKAEETLTTLDKDAANNGKYLYTSENATATTIDVVGDVIANSSTILNDPAFKTELTNVIKAEETLTTLVNNGGGSYTYNNEAGTAVNIDVVGDVTTNFSTIANNPAVTTIIQEIATKTAGAVTFDSTTNQFSYTDAAGVPQLVDISTIVKANETLTTLTKDAANNGKYVYTSENTTATTIDVVGDVIANSSTILNDPAFKTELSTVIKAEETLTTESQNLTTGAITYTNEAGTAVTSQVVSADAGNIVTVGTDGGAFVNNAVIKANETLTTESQNLTTGAITYTNEAGTAVTSQVVSADAGNIVTVGADGGAFVDNAIIKANETLTTESQNLTTGAITYTNEAGTAVTSQVVSADAGNIVTVGADGGAFVDNAIIKANETLTTESQNLTTGAITYTNEAGTAVTSQVVSADVGNIVTVGADGGAFVNNAVIKANETLTTESQNLTTGAITYTNEAGTAVTSQVVSADAGNIVTVGADGGAFVDNAVIKANETLTTESQNLTTGAITYTNEAGTAVTSQVVSADAGNIVTVGADGGAFVDNAIIKANETVTVITPIVTTGNTIATYTNEAAGTPVDIKETLTSLTDVVTQVTDEFGNVKDLHTLTYTDEVGTPNGIDLSVLVKGVETLTSLSYDGTTQSLIYQDEEGNSSDFKLTDLVGDAQTLTTLQVNLATGTLDFTDEHGTVNPIDLSAAVKEPWFSSTTNVGATLNTENIYTNGWVGIGYTTPSAATNEKLRVNGAITTINSYYADYVFEDYFKGFSEIKADYKFKRLSEVEDYIKKNKHLPGITPITELEKTKEGYSFNMSELSIQLLEKTEEIYLHIIEQNKEIEAKDKEIKELKLASESMNQRLEKLEKLILEKK